MEERIMKGLTKPLIRLVLKLNQIDCVHLQFILQNLAISKSLSKRIK